MQFLKSNSSLCTALFAGSLFSGLSVAQPSIEQQDWQPLFNGSNLDGWIPKIRQFAPGVNFADTFRVENGLLTVAYAGYENFDARFGHLFYAESFSHFRLRLEYRFVGEQVSGGPDWARRNSGVMLHAQAPDTMPADQDFPVSIEFQFLGGLGAGAARSTGNLCTPGTHVVYQGEFTTAHCINSTSPTFAGEQWVQAEVLVLGAERLVHFINGEVVLEYARPTIGGGAVSGQRQDFLLDGTPLDAGFIALQSESHPVQFRRIELLNLQGCMDPGSAKFRAYFVEPDPAACN